MTKLDDRNHVFDIAVVGGGLAGFAAAISVAEHGVDVVLIDANAKDHIGDTIRTTTINPISYKHLENLGVIAVLDAQGKPMTKLQQIKVSDEKSKPRPGFAVADELIAWENEDDDHPLGYVFRNSDLMPVLQNLVKKHPNITLYDGAIVDQCNDKHHRYGNAAAAITIKDGPVLSARLVVAADGRDSPLRKAAGIKSIYRNPGQTAIVADIRTSKPHQNMAWQRFITGGPAALMPIDDDHLMSLVWTLKDQDAKRLIDANDQAFNQSLMDHFGSGFGTLEVSSPRLTWPLRLNHAINPIASRLVLIGDAAHAIHPLAGQGYNLALGDTMALADLVQSQQRDGSDLGERSGLRRFARQRLAETAAMTLATDGLNAVFSFDHSFASSIAGMGMAVLNASPFKKIAIRAASGGLARLNRS